VTRAAAFILVLLGLVASGYTWVGKGFALHKGGSVALPHGAQIAAIELTAAARTMNAAKSYIGTYSQTDLRRYRNLTIAYANDNRFCLQVVQEGELYHLAGPGGTPAPGHC
jgi:hypothetical protein